jgi:Flp pilus assembly protein TadG
MLRRRLAQDESGLAAVEFALILPVMLIMFFGIFETSQALSARADVVNLTSAAADLVAQESTATAADISNVYAAASTMLAPYPSAGAKRPSIRITSIIDDGGAQHTTGTVGWFCTQSGSGTLSAAPSGQITLPQPMMTTGGSVIRVEVSYKYTSPTTQSITGPITMNSVFYTRPRRAMQITGPGTNC